MIKRRLLFFLFFLSGFSVLVYEVVWQRQLALIFGNTTQAVSAILTIFFAGLALGSWFFGRLVDRVKKPLLVYGFLELGIGFYAFLTPLIFSKLILLQAFLLRQWGTSSSYLLSFLVLIWPTILIGGTLPVISRFLVRNPEERGEVAGRLYGLNTFGSVLGAFLAGFFLIRFFGVKETVWLAAGINLLIGLVILSASRRQLLASRPVKRKQNQQLGATNYPLSIILLAFGLNGMAALALEVLWTRVLILTFGSSTYAFSTILTVFLLGIALGSFLASKFLVNKKNLLTWLVAFEFCLGVVVITFSVLLEKLPFLFLSFYQGKIGFLPNLWAAFGLSFLVMLLPTTLMGTIFPLVVKVFNQDLKKLGQDLGRLYGVNTVGGILGPILAGGVLIPLIGIQKGILVAGGLYFIGSVLFLVFAPLSRVFKVSFVSVVITLMSLSFLLPSWHQEFLVSGVFADISNYLKINDPKAEMKKGKILFYQEGLSATVAVKEYQGQLHLRINGKTDASTTGDRESFLLVGHLPLLLHPDPQEVLLIGLGSGLSLGAVEQHPVKKIDLVEIEPAVVEGAAFFADFNHHALEDERLKIIIGDGRHFLLTTNKKYDVISSHPSNPWFGSQAMLFTKEYYQLAAARLKENGLMLHWIQIYYLNSDDLKTAIATFRSVFPYVNAWLSPYSSDLLLVGSLQPFQINTQLLERKIKEKKIQNDLGDYGLDDAAKLLGYFVASQDDFKIFVQNARLHLDDRPLLEFSTPFALGQKTIGENLQTLLALQGEPYLFLDKINNSFKKKVEANLKLKENIFQAKVAVEQGDLQKSFDYFSQALEIDPQRESTKKELAQMYFFQAEDLFVQKDFASAKNALLKSIEFDPSRALAHLNLGAIYYQEGNLLEAAKEWKIAESLDPERPEVKQNLQLIEGRR